MDEETTAEIADHCLTPVKNELGTYQYQQVKDRIKAQLIIWYRMGVTKDREKEMAREVALMNYAARERMR